jgi:putative intracellular protease/amidase
MVTREALFDLVWAEPIVAVAKRFKVSGSYLARVCSRLNVPRPARGYWAKLAVEKAPARPALPPPRPGDETGWDPEGRFPEVAGTDSARPARRTAQGISSNGHSDESHELIKGAKPLFLTGRESRWGNYLKPSKRLLPEIHVTKAALDSALEFANAMFKQLEKRGHRVTLASPGVQIYHPPIDPRDKPDKRDNHADLWSPARRTAVYVNGTAIGIAIFELTEPTQMRYVNGACIREKDYVPPKSESARDAKWTSTQDIACGRFAVLAYSSFYTEKWTRTWKEERVGHFLKDAPRLAREIESCEAEAAAAVRRGKEAAEPERLRHGEMDRAWREEREKLRLRKSLTESKAELDRIMDEHAQRKRLEDFLGAIESRRGALDDATLRKLDELVVQARILYKSDSGLDDFLAWMPPTERLGPVNK